MLLCIALAIDKVALLDVPWMMMEGEGTAFDLRRGDCLCLNGFPQVPGGAPASVPELR